MFSCLSTHEMFTLQDVLHQLLLPATSWEDKRIELLLPVWLYLDERPIAECYCKCLTIFSGTAEIIGSSRATLAGAVS